MGTYLNPGNSGFAEIVSDDYIDKTGMIDLVNRKINKPQKLICISRPRRFGKSYAAQMLCAYYDHTCDSHRLFEDKEAAKTEYYEDCINKYNVIYLDMTNLLGKVKPESLIAFIEESVTEELLAEYQELKRGSTFDQTLINTVESGNPKFIMIIDEWDAPIRETPQITKEYLLFLRMLFKSSNTTSKIFAAAYMTGILPIKKDKGQSAVSDFDEFTVLEPGEYSEYIGFTENEVRYLCDRYHMSFEKAKQWYDGYTFSEAQSIYNPYSIMKAMQKRVYRSYWQQTSAAENLETLININKDGLQEDILKLIAGEQVVVNTGRFKNDFATFTSKDDVLTLLIHLGYLVYNSETRRVRIPNEEVRFEFDDLLRNAQYTGLAKLVQDSEKLLQDTLNCNEAEVVNAIVRVRNTNYAPMFYNNEQALRYVIKFAYIVCIDYYLKVEELPTGHGIADVVFLPKRDTSLPAMIVELKWNRTAEGAIRQIKEKDYPSLISEYTGDLLLVGINYDEDTKKHSCKIEKVKM
ncbi:MAG: AAA family ATPase [Lachnospiraceae bacterium]|nr:AAA family ATPase [Lachnospiraceae bacterium]